jgi:hypothetical protein
VARELFFTFNLELLTAVSFDDKQYNIENKVMLTVFNKTKQKKQFSGFQHEKIGQKW